MNDFLHNLRTNAQPGQNQQQNEKQKFAGNRRQYDNGTYANDRRASMDRRNTRQSSYYSNNKPYSRPETDQLPQGDELIDSIRDMLMGIENSQRKISIAMERNAIAEERKAEAFEAVAFQINQIGDLIKSVFEGQTSLVEALGIPADAFTQKPEKRTRKRVITDERRVVLDKIMELRDKGATYNEIADFLTNNNYTTFSGRGRWHAQTIHRLCQ